MSGPEKVSIIIPVKPGGEVRALALLRDVDYPADSWEVIVAEGRCPSLQRNQAAAFASGDILYFIDDDSQVGKEFLRRAVAYYADPDVAAVGGPSLTPDTDSTLQHTFGMAFASTVGGGGMRNRYRKTGRARSTCDQELILCNLSFRRDIFQEFGGFDERLYPNEENELMERIGKNGKKQIHDPELAILRSHRPTMTAFCRQLFSYGRGRGEQTVLSGVIKPITFIPSLFVLYLLCLPYIENPIYYLPLLCYLCMIITVALFHMAVSGRVGAALLLPAIFPVFHLCYGVGLIRGLVRPRHKTGAENDSRVFLRKVKEFGGAWPCKE